MSDYPEWVTDTADQVPEVEVDWAALPEDWREQSYRVRWAGESRAEHANRVRALVVEGLVGAGELGFADWLAS